MKRYFLVAVALLTLLAVLCTGCGKKQAEEAPPVETTRETVPPTVPATVPADGDPDDVTCKGTYTAETPEGGAVVAKVGDAQLTNGELAAYYWLEVAAWKQGSHEENPDFSKSLDTQVCEADPTVNSWQQFFLARALKNWSAQQALVTMGTLEGTPVEEAYEPPEKYHTMRLEGRELAAKHLIYGYSNQSYRPNAKHQAYLDQLPQLLEDLAAQKGYASAEEMARSVAGTDAAGLLAAAEVWNRGYMYFTELGYALTASEEEVQARKADFSDLSGKTVTVHHLLLLPPETDKDGVALSPEDSLAAGLKQAEALMAKYNKDPGYDTFAELANDNSQDTGSAVNGGLYVGLQPGQLSAELDSWCFDEARQPGDTVILQSGLGIHMLYFRSATENWYAAAEDAVLAEKSDAVIAAAVKNYPAKISYEKIQLGTVAQDGQLLTVEELLYPDLAHERYPEVPIYLQQDYPKSKYGNYKVSTHGCGICAMSMLATYMTDEEYTPHYMGATYGRYCGLHGSDSSMFLKIPAELGFYADKQTHNFDEVIQALEDGKMVATLQHKGHYTTSGHFLILCGLTEEGRIIVRDSNIHNYGRLEGHIVDSFEQKTIQTKMFWIMEPKIVTIPACSRCGDAESRIEGLLTGEYLCEKCVPALERRGNYLNYFG